MPAYERCFSLPCRPEAGKLYGDLCAVLPPQYAVGQGYSLDTLRFAVENGARLELHFTRRGPPGCRAVFLPAAGASTAPQQAEVYLELFAELATRLTANEKTPEP